MPSLSKDAMPWHIREGLSQLKCKFRKQKPPRAVPPPPARTLQLAHALQLSQKRVEWLALLQSAPDLARVHFSTLQRVSHRSLFTDTPWLASRTLAPSGRGHGWRLQGEQAAGPASTAAYTCAGRSSERRASGQLQSSRCLAWHVVRSRRLLQ